MEMTSQRGIHRVSPACTIPDLAQEITAALLGTGPALAFGDVRSTSAPSNIALVIGTSGTTGLSKEVTFTADALLASARASNSYLNAQPGQQWSLLLPLTHIAAVNVIIRSMELGTLPIDLREHQGEFPKADFTSIVPTQLFRALNSDERLLHHLQSTKAVLVGGAALSSVLRQQAEAAGIQVVETYGMTETSGGCIYNGSALEGVEFSLNEKNLIQIRGNVMSESYLNAPELYTLNNGWFVTNDLGEIVDGKIRVLGRADDVIISGGENISLTAIEATLSIKYPEIEFAAFAVNDIQWGHALHLALVGEVSESEILLYLEAALGAAYKPKGIHHLESIPLLGIGKTDRIALSKMVGHE